MCDYDDRLKKESLELLFAHRDSIRAVLESLSSTEDSEDNRERMIHYGNKLIRIENAIDYKVQLLME